jgi:hypothetical protein
LTIDGVGNIYVSTQPSANWRGGRRNN